MKTKLQFLRWLIMLMLSLSALGAWAQTDPSPTQTVCIGNEPYKIDASALPSPTYHWSITPGNATNWQINGTGTNITVDWKTSGIYNLSVYTSSNGCDGPAKTVVVTVNPNNTIALSSAAGTDGQTVCINNAITSITYATTGATGVTFSGLPAGVTGNWAANVVTISGTPTASGTFNYTVTLTGGCATVTATGTITVTPANTIALSSAAGTDGQTVCIITPIINITYATTGATGATFSGLPAGVSGSWAANVVTISGTPTVSGIFNYTVTLTGGCANITASGTVTINPLPATSPIYHN